MQYDFCAISILTSEKRHYDKAETIIMYPIRYGGPCDSQIGRTTSFSCRVVARTEPIIGKGRVMRLWSVSCSPLRFPKQGDGDRSDDDRQQDEVELC